MNRFIKWKPLLLNLAISLGTGILSGLITKDSMKIFENLNKPSFTPQGSVFPVIWTILFLLMGISAYIIYVCDTEDSSHALFIYLLQLVVNFFWPILFFLLQLRFFAFLWLLLLWILILAMIVRFRKINPFAAYLQIPYLLWVTFAVILNLSIYFMNR